MSMGSCSLLSCGTGEDRSFSIEDYEGAQARWCAGCGDHGILASNQRLIASEQLPPEQTVYVSGIGCSSRFPHYMKTYGFHGIHGRALPIATGVKLARPDLHVFVVMGDGDCTSIGAAHWVHAIRYNVKMVAMMLDNNIYGLTKNQTSPTTPQGHPSNTQPQGSILPALNPLQVSLGITNASFIAQTADWVPAHLYATLKAAYHHNGFAFVRILQRCPIWTPGIFRESIMHPETTEVLKHEDGVDAPELDAIYKNHIRHDPSDIHAARELAADDEKVRIGVFYRNETLQRYDELRQIPIQTAEQKIEKLNRELDRYAV